MTINRAPDLLEALAPPPRAPLTLPDYEAALLAIGDREELAADAGERARLGRVRAELEHQAADLLAE